jgi:hypothetical protein
LLRPVSVTIPSGQTRKVALRLTPGATRTLRRRGRLAVRVGFELRVRGRVVERSTRTTTFRLARTPGRAPGRTGRG